MGDGVRRELGARLRREGPAAGTWLPTHLSLRSPWDARPWGHKRSTQPLQNAAAGHYHNQYIPATEMAINRFQS